jgi:hypothetical protein
VQGVDEVWQRAFPFDAPGGDQFASALPGHHDREHDDRDEQRQPATVGDLGQVRGEEGQLDAAEGDPEQP